MGLHRGEAARPRVDVHYGDLVTPTACELTAETMPFADTVSLRSSLVTCERCLTALAKQAGGSR